MSKHFELVKPTFIENWPQDLCRLSLAQTGIKLDRFTAIVLGMQIKDYGEAFSRMGRITLPETFALSSLETELDNEIATYPKGCYVRLGSRGPKDALYPTVWPATTGAHAIQNLTAGSERISDDLQQALAENYDPYIWLRQWLPVEPQHEFRCFMKDRKFIGASQYNYFNGAIPWQHENSGELEWIIRDIFFPQFKQASHLDNVVFDLIIRNRDCEWTCKLLEINPFFNMTDACLFDWRKPEDFDGSLRLLPVKEKV